MHWLTPVRAQDLEETWGARQAPPAKIFGLPLPIVTLALGTFALFCCVGSQEGLSSVFSTLVSQFRPGYVIFLSEFSVWNGRSGPSRHGLGSPIDHGPAWTSQ